MGSFDFGHWLLVGFFVFLGWKMLGGGAKGPSVYCTTCGSIGNAKVRTRGSIFIEFILWLCFLVPGLIYSVWRMTTRAKVCSNCGSESVIPENSPAAIQAKRSAVAPVVAPPLPVAAPEAPVFHWPSTNTVVLDVVGESNYQPALKKLQRRGSDHTAHLVPEPENPYDENAIKVVIDGLKVGYLSRDDAVEFGDALKARGLAGKTTSCKASLTGGHQLNAGSVASIGVEVDLNPYD